MLRKILEGCQGQNAVPRHGVLAADRPPRKINKHTFLLLPIILNISIITSCMMIA